MDRDLPVALRALLQQQVGVVARRQLPALGLEPHDLQRLVRRRDLVPVHRGVCVDHTGPLTRAQREWAGVLACWPAALTGRSVVRGADDPLVHVAIDDRRTVGPFLGVRVHRTAHLGERVQWHRSPPCVAVEHAALDLASEHGAAGRVAAAFDVLAVVCRDRVTTPARLAATAASRRRLPASRLLRSLIDDLASGADSVLERGFLHRVERAHALPTGRRQHRVRANGRTRYTDVDYDGFGVIVELDGRAFHDAPTARDRDAVRDLDTLVERAAVTLRLTYGLVFDQPCETAAPARTAPAGTGVGGDGRAVPGVPLGGDRRVMSMHRVHRHRA